MKHLLGEFSDCPLLRTSGDSDLRAKGELLRRPSAPLSDDFRQSYFMKDLSHLSSPDQTEIVIVRLRPSSRRAVAATNGTLEW